MSEQFKNTPRYAVGSRAPRNGRYAILDAHGERTGKVLVTDAGRLLPKIDGIEDAQFVFVEPIEPRFSTSGSADVVLSTATSYGQLMDDLAKR